MDENDRKLCRGVQFYLIAQCIDAVLALPVLPFRGILSLCVSVFSIIGLWNISRVLYGVGRIILFTVLAAVLSVPAALTGGLLSAVFTLAAGVICSFLKENKYMNIL